MKKTILLSMVALAASVNLQAQEEQRPSPERGPRMTQESARPNRYENGERRPELSPEQWAELQTKKMTLALDLNSKQQKAVAQLMRLEAKKRQDTRVPKNKKTNQSTHNLDKNKGQETQRFTRQLARLDQKIEYKSAMKAILNDQQYEQWSRHFTRKLHRKTQEKGQLGKGQFRKGPHRKGRPKEGNRRSL
jgi:periplasmic protein CpxP/Spy